MRTLESLLRDKAWANSTLFDALAEVSSEIVETKRSIVFGSLVRTLHHTYAMDRVWRSHLEGVPHSYTTRNPRDCPPLAELRALQAEVDAWYIRYAAHLPSESEEEEVAFEFIGGGSEIMRRSEILLHVVNHGTYHRGHVGAMLYESGVQPPTTDFPVYLRNAT